MSVQIKGVAELVKRLGALNVIKVLRPPMQRGVYRLQRAMQDYPVPPRGSRYTRTGTLGRRWTTRIEASANGITGTVGNNTAYGPLVQSSRFQTRGHKRTGWTTDEQVVKDNERVIVDDFQREMQRSLT